MKQYWLWDVEHSILNLCIAKAHIEMKWWSTM